MTGELKAKCPQDLVAIFHASFHPTRGHLVDWSLKASDDLNLDNVEFSALPSGLHLVEQDVVYFTKDGQPGVCVFRRRKTMEAGHRGFRLSSLGILLARSRRPRPWRHVNDLKKLIDRIYAQCEVSGLLQPTEDQWEPARLFFEERKVRRVDLGGAGDWAGWSHELGEIEAIPPSANPTFHLSHMLRILGPSSLTLYKHVLTRRRILIYTLPPVEPACILCQIAADMCYDVQHESDEDQPSHPGIGRLKGKSKEPINVLGMVTLSDIDRLRSEGTTGRGWIACTTDAIFLEKPSCYDLLIDLTTSTPQKATRPTFYASKPILPQAGSSRQTHRLSVIRFAWSDVRLWNELERILHLDSDNHGHHPCCGPSTSSDPGLKNKLISPWTDVWRVYEDVCIICAGLWMGAWRNNASTSYNAAEGEENWGAIHLEGDDDFGGRGNAYIRNLGMGIEGRPMRGSSESGSTSGKSKNQSQTTVGHPHSPTSSTSTSRAMRRTSAMSWSSGKTTTIGSFGNGKGRQVSSSAVHLEDVGGSEAFHEDAEQRDRQLLTTLALLQTFHAHTSFQLSVLESFLPAPQNRDSNDNGEATVYLTPKDVLTFELGPLSGSDLRYLEWLGQEFAGPVKVVVKRGWKDLLGAIFGYA